jgi:hypothetical protein
MPKSVGDEYCLTGVGAEKYKNNEYQDTTA